MELFRRGEVLSEGRSTEAEEKLSGQATRFHPVPTSDMTIPLTDTFSTAMLVTTASFHGLPVSTTHVSVGSLLGMGIVTGQTKWKPVLGVLASWVVTLPCAALLAGLTYKLAAQT